MQSTGVPFFAVDYRLAPTHKIRNQLEDGYAALMWLHLHAEEFNVDPNHIAVYEESAGGCLAAWVALEPRDDGVSPAFAKRS